MLLSIILSESGISKYAPVIIPSQLIHTWYLALGNITVPKKKAPGMHKRPSCPTDMEQRVRDQGACGIRG